MSKADIKLSRKVVNTPNFPSDCLFKLQPRNLLEIRRKPSSEGALREVAAATGVQKAPLANSDPGTPVIPEKG